LRYLKPEGIVWFCQSDNRLVSRRIQWTIDILLISC
jgi:hypothetical protein